MTTRNETMTTGPGTLALLLGLSLLASSRAEEARFFRITGPVAATITALSANGYVTWTNAPTNATFTVQTAQSLLGPSNWVDYIQVPVTNPVTTHRLFDPNPPAGMVFIPAGSFRMGDTFNEGNASEWPAHTVYVSAFYMGANVVSQDLWVQVAQWATTNGYSLNPDLPVGAKGATYPLHPGGMAIVWCNARSEKEGLTPCYYTDTAQTTVYRTWYVSLNNECVRWAANGYRLPTEAEWEKGARGGSTGKRFPWGDLITHSNANYYSSANYSYDVSPTRGWHPAYATGNYDNTSPVGSFAPNRYGLHDMAGNVIEYLWDWFDATYYSSSPSNDPRGPESGVMFRAVRGGSWFNNAREARCANREFVVPPGPEVMGFRCVRGL